jgi:hypothetical protein
MVRIDRLIRHYSILGGQNVHGDISILYLCDVGYKEDRFKQKILRAITPYIIRGSVKKTKNGMRNIYGE